MYLTPIKIGEQIAWLKEIDREEDSDQTGDEYVEVSDCSITSDKSKRSKTENRPPLSSVGQKQTLALNVEPEFTSQSSFKRRSELKQRKLQENEDTLKENVNEESVRGRRMISEKTVEGNVELSQSVIKSRSDQKQRELQYIQDALEENVNEEIVVDRRMISEKITEGNVELEFTPLSPIKKRSEQKQRKLLESEDTLEENVNQESVYVRRIISEQTLEENERFESASQSLAKKNRSDRKRRKVEDEDTLEENVNEESVDERRMMSEETLEGNGRFEFTSSSPIKKRSEQKQRKLLKSKDILEENVNQESVDERRIISEKTLEGNRRFEFTLPSPMKKRSKQKQRKLQESEYALKENVNEENVSDTAITPKKRLQNNVELECAAKENVSNNNNIKIAVKRKVAKRKWGVVRESDSQASFGMETPEKLAREDGYCEDKRNDEYKKTYDRKTPEEASNISDGRQEGNQIETLKKNKKEKREKRKEKSQLCGTESTPESTPTSSLLEEVESSQRKDQLDGSVQREFASNVKNKHQISNAMAEKRSDCDLLQKQESLAFIGEKKFKKKDRYWEKGSEDDEKSNDRKTSDQEEKVNNRDEIYVQQRKKRKKKKEKRRKDELMESATELPSSLTLETVTSDSLDDSGCCENGLNKSKQHQHCVSERVESVHQPRIYKKRKAVANHEKETLSGQGLLV